ncbi:MULTISPECIES: FliM/FliN family flagellar motor switch protein [Serratia]|uniref:FliM/FliN family flagellar motor switch protein n=1 Tax=Serratia TaxID=613 RepID=UPI000CF68ABC|nr:MULTISPECIES: FliM/FliN family flagellar motor switch protein [Serratia]AVJ19286.1 aldolase [Serratia sp. MYb239]MEB6334379.1 FliM/FliN family flagellar motor switch protein [Serratia rhizosphaerae]
MSTPLKLRRQSAAEARLRGLLGHGLRLAFQLGERAGELRIEPAAGERQAAETALRCMAGPLWLSDAEGVCALLSDCPALPTAGDEDDLWYWPLFNHALSAQIRALFGELNAADGAPPAGAFGVRLTVTLGDLRAQSALTAAPEVLCALLAAPGWQGIVNDTLTALPLTLPFCVGALTLSLAELTRLQPDDVLLPREDTFTPHGAGTLRFAHFRAQGELVGEEGRSTGFYLTDLETTSVTFPYNDNETESDVQDESGMERRIDAEPAGVTLDPLPLALTVRCGHLHLTVGDLQRLAPGATIMVDHVQPGEALLCHGDYPLAKGELVDVEGRLGLQITHMLPGSVNPLGQGR